MRFDIKQSKWDKTSHIEYDSCPQGCYMEFNTVLLSLIYPASLKSTMAVPEDQSQSWLPSAVSFIMEVCFVLRW